jgi:hypothetical protein
MDEIELSCRPAGLTEVSMGVAWQRSRDEDNKCNYIHTSTLQGSCRAKDHSMSLCWSYYSIWLNADNGPHRFLLQSFPGTIKLKCMIFIDIFSFSSETVYFWQYSQTIKEKCWGLVSLDPKDAATWAKFHHANLGHKICPALPGG